MSQVNAAGQIDEDDQITLPGEELEAETEIIEGDEDETTTTPETIVKEDVDPGLLRDALPALAPYFHEMTPRAQLEYALKELVAARADRALGQGAEAQAEATAASNPQPIEDIPVIDRVAMRTQFVRAVEEGDANSAGEIFDGLVGYTDSVLQNVAGALHESRTQQHQLRQEMNSLRQPDLLKAALKEVPAATEDDIVAAAEYLKSGDATNHKAALALAATDRIYRTQKANPPERTPSEEAARRAAGRAASDAGSQTRFPSRARMDNSPITMFNATTLAGADDIIPENLKKPKRRKG